MLIPFAATCADIKFRAIPCIRLPPRGIFKWRRDQVKRQNETTAARQATYSSRQPQVQFYRTYIFMLVASASAINCVRPHGLPPFQRVCFFLGKPRLSVGRGGGANVRDVANFFPVRSRRPPMAGITVRLHRDANIFRGECD